MGYSGSSGSAWNQSPAKDVAFWVFTLNSVILVCPVDAGRLELPQSGVYSILLYYIIIPLLVAIGRIR